MSKCRLCEPAIKLFGIYFITYIDILNQTNRKDQSETLFGFLTPSRTLSEIRSDVNILDHLRKSGQIS